MTNNFAAFNHKYTYPSNLLSAEQQDDSNLMASGSNSMVAGQRRKPTENFDFISNEEFLKHVPSVLDSPESKSVEEKDEFSDNSAEDLAQIGSPRNQQKQRDDESATCQAYQRNYKEGRAQIEGGSRMAQRDHAYQDLIMELVDDHHHPNQSSQ